jgi:hypothetical protein
MSETKFTKGEWVQRYGNLVKIGEAEWEFDSCADASLVASAPEMYAMLESFLCLEGLIKTDKIKILLAKARGESC